MDNFATTDARFLQKQGGNEGKMAFKRPLLFRESQLMAAPETLALPCSLFTALSCLPSNAPITSGFVLTRSEKKILFGGVRWGGGSEKLPDQLDLWLGLKLVYL